MDNILLLFNNVPAISFPICLAVCFASVILAVPLGYIFNMHFLTAGAVMASFGVTLACTLTIGPEGLEQTRCSFLDPEPTWNLLTTGAQTLNIWLFIPLGFSVCFVRSKTQFFVLLPAVLLLTFIIEITQLMVTALHRSCQVQDMVANSQGLLLGLFAGLVVRSVWLLRKS